MMLSSELEREIDNIKQYARQYGLDFFEVVFEFVDFEEMNKLAAYIGFPVR